MEKETAYFADWHSDTFGLKVNFYNLLQSAVTWPWDADYNIPPSEDVFSSGVLCIRARIYLLGYPKERLPYGGLSDDSHISCDLTSPVVNIAEWWDFVLLVHVPARIRYWEVEYRNLVLAVEVGADGTYYRCGLRWVTDANLASASFEEKIIRLG